MTGRRNIGELLLKKPCQASYRERRICALGHQKAASEIGMATAAAAAAKYIEPLKFITDIMELPMFIVSGHACLCPLSGPCEPDASPLFTLPDDTYMMSWVAPEEIFCDINSEEMIYKNRFHLLQYLYHHSQSDILRGP
jgi:hypothetical protein